MTELKELSPEGRQQEGCKLLARRGWLTTSGDTDVLGLLNRTKGVSGWKVRKGQRLPIWTPDVAGNPN